MVSIKKILVPTDFSNKASTAYHSAGQLARRYGAIVDFIHIIPTKNYFTDSLAKLGLSLHRGHELHSRMQEEASAQLQNLLNEHIKPEFKGTHLVEMAAKPWQAIAERAENNNYDMIVMAAKGKHASDLFRGSITKKVMRYSKVPVFSTEQSHISECQNILVPTDGTVDSLRALPLAISLASAFNAKITLYYAWVLRRPLLEEGSEELLESTYQRLKNEVFSAMNVFFAESSDKVKLEEDGVGKGRLVYHQKDATVTIDIRIIVQKSISKYDAITDYAQEKADIMVMSTQGRKGLWHAIFGSVAEEVARVLKLPVITVHTDV